MEKVYELTITPNYVSDWNFCDAIRELIQNGTDQEIVDSENRFSIHYDSVKKILRLRNDKSKLKINTLLLGRSSKSDNEDTVGKFGEGYKIAALVLNRIGKTFTIYNNELNEIWQSRFKNSEKWREKILAFYVDKQPTEETGLIIEIGNVNNSEYREIENVWLHMNGLDWYSKINTQYGEILTDEEFGGKVYVNGLVVNYDNDMHYGYNFKPNYITLERDRKTCDSWQMGEVTAMMICEAVLAGNLELSEVMKLTDMNASDIYHMNYQTYRSDTKKVGEMLLKQFDLQNPGCVPVETQEEYDRVKTFGGKPVIVPKIVGNVLRDETKRRIHTLATAKVPDSFTVKDMFERWLNAYFTCLSGEAIDEFREILGRLD
jgi:hypothetical protein